MYLRTLVLAVLSLVLVTACARDGASPQAVERDRLERRQDEFIAALAARDADRAAALFAEDAVIHVANMPPLEGREAIHRFYGNLFNYLSASEATLERLEISASGDMAYATGRASNEFRSAEGSTGYTGKYVLVWKKIDDDWRIALYGVSSNESGASRDRASER